MLRLILTIMFGALVVPFIAFGATNIVVNEIQTAGQTSKDEFVELYNPTDASIDVTGWRLTKKTATGNEANLVSTFSSMSIQPHGFLLIAHPTDYKGSVSPDLTYSTSNTIADDNTVILYRDAGDTIVDLVGVGKATVRDGTPAPNPDAGQSITRRDGLDTNNNGADFIIAAPTPTNKAGSIGSTPPPPVQATSTPVTSGEQSSTTTAQKISTADVVVNEVYPNPLGTDEEEFIELKNSGTQTVDVSRWEVGTSRGRRFVVGANTMMQPGGFLLLPRSMSGLALDNSGDVVSLYLPEEERPFFTVRYTTDAAEGLSYARSDGGKRWQWTTTRTPSTTNILTDPPLPPVLAFDWSPESPDAQEVVTFDASDSFDPDREPIAFTWEFGDEQHGEGVRVAHGYETPGRYTVRLTGTTATDAATMERTLVVQGSIIVDVPKQKTNTPIIEGDAEPSARPLLRGEDKPALRSLGEGGGEVAHKVQILSTKKPSSHSNIISGIVLVPPGRFGKTRAMIQVESHTITAQYTTGTWPDIFEGATVRLAGRVSPTDPDRFLVSAIVDVSTTTTPLKSEIISSTDWKDMAPGTLVQMRGEITERHGSTFFIDDGAGEVRAQIKATAGISASAIQEGSRATVTGVVLATTSGNVLTPRGLEDIAIDALASRERQTPFWGESSSRRPWWYGGIVLSGALIASGAWFMRKKTSVRTIPSHEAAVQNEDVSLDDDG